nr:MAG TPA: hypothetical protein [Bacteriophage sp.]
MPLYYLSKVVQRMFLIHVRSFGAPHPGDNSWMRMYDM